MRLSSLGNSISLVIVAFGQCQDCKSSPGFEEKRISSYFTPYQSCYNPSHLRRALYGFAFPPRPAYPAHLALPRRPSGRKHSVQKLGTLFTTDRGTHCFSDLHKHYTRKCQLIVTQCCFWAGGDTHSDWLQTFH